MASQLIVVVILEALYSRLLDRVVYPFDLAVRPRVFDPCDPVLDADIMSGCEDPNRGQSNCGGSDAAEYVRRCGHRDDFVELARKQDCPEKDGGDSSACDQHNKRHLLGAGKAGWRYAGQQQHVDQKRRRVAEANRHSRASRGEATRLSCRADAKPELPFHFPTASHRR